LKFFLEEIPSKDRNLIKYVYLQGIQIAIKACFKEGINSSIISSLHDQRFKNIQNSHLGTLQGNLIYSKLIFECYTNYSVTLRSKNIEDTLNLQYKLLIDIILQPKINSLSFYHRGLYLFSNTGFPIKEINKKWKKKLQSTISYQLSARSSLHQNKSQITNFNRFSSRKWWWSINKLWSIHIILYRTRNENC